MTVRHQVEQLYDGSQLSSRSANGTIKGLVVQSDISQRHLSFTYAILKQKQVDTRRPDDIGPKRSEEVRISEGVAETGDRHLRSGPARLEQRDGFRQIFLEDGAFGRIEPRPVIDLVGNIPAGERCASSGRGQIVKEPDQLLQSPSKVGFEKLRRLLDLFPVARIQRQPEPDANPRSCSEVQNGRERSAVGCLMSRRPKQRLVIDDCPLQEEGIDPDVPKLVKQTTPLFGRPGKLRVRQLEKRAL